MPKRNKNDQISWINFNLIPNFVETPQKQDFNQTVYEQIFPKNECKLSAIKTYWLDFHKPIYIAFNLPNTLPMYNKKPLTFPFLKNIIYVTPGVIHDAFPI